MMGHSNGGQGTWYLSSRYPDRILGGRGIWGGGAPTFFFFANFGPNSHTRRRIHQIPGLCTSNNGKVEGSDAGTF